jgi:hypothetical protein
LHPVSYRRGHELDLDTETGGDEMSTWKKFLIGGAAVLTLGAGATTVALAAGGNSPGSVVDISGPCDEAEHANDPRCTGGAAAAGDNSGPGNGNTEGRDNSGPSENSGPGNADDDDDADEDDEDNSGPGHGDDDEDDDSGSGGDDD